MTEKKTTTNSIASGAGIGDGWEAVKSNFMKFEKIGDSCQGVFVHKKLVDSTLPGKEGVKQTIYTLVQEDGTEINVGGRGQGNPQVLPQLEAVKPGTPVKVVYEDEKPAKTKGFAPAKLIRVYAKNAVNQPVLDKWRKEHGLDFAEVATEGQPF